MYNLVVYDSAGDGWSGGGAANKAAADGALRYNTTLISGFDGVAYLCLEDGVYHIKITATDSEISWEFDDITGNRFTSGAPVDGVFHMPSGGNASG